MDLVKHLQESIDAVDSKLVENELGIEGFSSRNVRHLINNVCSIPKATYLEVGLYKGSTFFSALKSNRLRAFGIDNWSEFNGPSEEFNKFLPFYTYGNDVTIIDVDVFKLNLELITKPVDIYFYDGDHSEESQAKALTYMLPVLNHEFIFMVDDYNWPLVRAGTRRGIQESGVTVLSEYELGAGTCANLPGQPLREDAFTVGYWNGIYAAVLKKV